MSVTTVETTITRAYLRNRTKDEIINHVMRLLDENDKLTAEVAQWRENHKRWMEIEREKIEQGDWL